MMRFTRRRERTLVASSRAQLNAAYPELGKYLLQQDCCDFVPPPLRKTGLAAPSARELLTAQIGRMNVWPILRAPLSAALFRSGSDHDPARADDETWLARTIAAQPELVAELWSELHHQSAFWQRRIDSGRYDRVLVDGGADISSRVLLELCKTAPVVPHVVYRPWLSGPFFVEQRYEPLPNNLSLRFANDYDARCATIPAEPARSLLRRDAIRRLMSVLGHEPPLRDLTWSARTPYLLILLQSVDDPALTSVSGTGNPLQFYRELIASTLRDTSLSVIVFAHDWDRARSPAGMSSTLAELTRFVALLPAGQRERYALASDTNWSELFRRAEHIVTLSSTAGLGAALSGTRIIQCGHAWYGQRGFTSDVASAGEALALMTDHELTRLSLAEYALFEQFVLVMLGMTAIDAARAHEQLREILPPRERVSSGPGMAARASRKLEQVLARLSS